MKILLLNDNPVVTKLVTLSAQKTSDELEIVSTIDAIKDKKYDLLIVDDAMYSEQVYALLNENITFEESLYICSRSTQEVEDFTKTLKKPFLPTDLVELFALIGSNSSSFDTDEIEDVEELEPLEMLSEDDDLNLTQEMSLDESDEISLDDELLLDDEFLLHEEDLEQGESVLDNEEAQKVKDLLDETSSGELDFDDELDLSDDELEDILAEDESEDELLLDENLEDIITEEDTEEESEEVESEDKPEDELDLSDDELEDILAEDESGDELLLDENLEDIITEEDTEEESEGVESEDKLEDEQEIDHELDFEDELILDEDEIQELSSLDQPLEDEDKLETSKESDVVEDLETLEQEEELGEDDSMIDDDLDLQKDNFLEYALVHGNYYGTSLKPVKKALSLGKLVIFDIDVQGNTAVKDRLGDITTSVFITPPSLSELERRLVSRSTDAQEVIDARIKMAKREIQRTSEYDFLVVNDDLDIAAEVLRQIAVTARLKIPHDKINAFVQKWEDI